MSRRRPISATKVDGARANGETRASRGRGATLAVTRRSAFRLASARNSSASAGAGAGVWHDCRMTSTMSEWLAIASGRAVRQPADELRDARSALRRAEEVGDRDAIDAANGRIDELFEAARERRREEQRESAAAARFSSGVRKPLVKRPSPNQQMDAAILRATGRLR